MGAIWNSIALAAALVVVAGRSEASSCPEVGFTLVEPKAGPTVRAVKGRGDKTIYVHREAITYRSEITEAKLDDDGVNEAAVSLKFTPDAGARLEAATTHHDGLRIAFVQGDRALMVATWTGDYGMGKDGAQLHMNDRAAAHTLADVLAACVGKP